MIISLVAAMTPSRIIGKDNQLPWKMPADLAHFKKITLDKPILMGRKTYESIGRLLPHRKNIIISRDKHFKIDGAEIFHDITTALENLSQYPEVCVIGGSEIFSQVINKADLLYLSYIYADHIMGDCYFPMFNTQQFTEISRENHKADANNPYDYSFVVLKKN